MINRRLIRSLPAVLGVSLLVVAGCARLPKKQAALDTETRIVPVKEDAETQKRIEAFAHFATGLSHDLNDKPNEATSEFLQSALADPGNQELVMDVVRRLIREGNNTEAVNLLKK